MKKSNFLISLSALCLISGFYFSEYASAKPQKEIMVGGSAMVSTKNIVENASNSKDHTTLVTAIKGADLVKTLSGKGPYTVFAPTNAAFAKLPDGTVESLLRPENEYKLSKILTYHVVAGSLKKKDLKNGQTLKTVQGETLKISVKNGNTYVNDSLITIPDVVSSNGITQVINTVLSPSS